VLRGEFVLPIWTYFGATYVPPKWMIKDGRDIWVVKCAASLRRKRSVFEENGHLTTQMSQEQLRQRFGGPERAPKPLLDRKPNKWTAQQKLRMQTRG
jgi:hypothetical protein